MRPQTAKRQMQKKEDIVSGVLAREGGADGHMPAELVPAGRAAVRSLIMSNRNVPHTYIYIYMYI